MIWIWDLPSGMHQNYLVLHRSRDHFKYKRRLFKALITQFSLPNRSKALQLFPKSPREIKTRCSLEATPQFGTQAPC